MDTEVRIDVNSEELDVAIAKTEQLRDLLIEVKQIADSLFDNKGV